MAKIISTFIKNYHLSLGHDKSEYSFLRFYKSLLKNDGLCYSRLLIFDISHTLSFFFGID